MLNTMLSGFYKRDLHKLIDEVNLFKSEEDLWKTQGTIANPAGNLVLHILGGSNYFIGNLLAKTGYVRHRDLEFIEKDVPREVIIRQLEELSSLTTKTLDNFSSEDMEADFPVLFDGKQVSNSYLLVQLLGHLNYHTGQINYIRRMQE